MKKMTITLSTGETYPFEFTMGAMLLFKKETGKEATEADFSSLSDLLTILWGGVVAATEATGGNCPYTLQQFANRIDKPTLVKWQEEVFDMKSTNSADVSKKKKKGKYPESTDS